MSAFHDGLSAELKTRYNAPKVRTVMANQGHTKTSLLTEFNSGSRFLFPALEPESVTDAVCRQIFSRRSGQVLTPTFERFLQLL